MTAAERKIKQRAKAQEANMTEKEKPNYKEKENKRRS